MVLEDDSFSGNTDKGLLVSFFNRQISNLPQIESVGQIIHCNRFKIQSYQNRLQAISTNYCSFSVFNFSILHKRLCWTVTRSNQKMETPTEREIEICNQLYSKDISDTCTPTSSRDLLEISMVKSPNLYFDWIAQVIKGPLEGDKSVETFIMSDFTPTSLDSHCRVETTPPLASNLLVPVTFWDNYADEARLLLKEGMVVKIENLRSKIHSNSLSLVLHGDPSNIRKIFILEEVPSSFEKKRNLIFGGGGGSGNESKKGHSLIKKDDFLSQRFAPKYFIKLTKGFGVPSTPIRTILSLEEEDFPAKFILSCRIKDTTPSDIVSFSHPKCNNCGRVSSVSYDKNDGNCRCNICKKSSFYPSDWGWMFSLLLEDSDGQLLPVIFIQDDAVKFFSGLEATNLEEDMEGLEKLGDIMSSINDGGIHLLCIRAQMPGPKYRICNSIIVKE